MALERWLPVIGYEGAYEVSDQGRVRSLDRLITYTKRNPATGRLHEIVKTVRARVLRLHVINKSGHLVATLTGQQQVLVHVIVLEAFVGPCPVGHWGLHRNDAPGDNALANLRWGTRADNAADAVANGRIPGGEQHWRSILTDPQVRELRASSRPCSYFADKFKVSVSTVSAARRKQNWRSVA